MAPDAKGSRQRLQGHITHHQICKTSSLAQKPHSHCHPPPHSPPSDTVSFPREHPRRTCQQSPSSIHPTGPPSLENKHTKTHPSTNNIRDKSTCNAHEKIRTQITTHWKLTGWPRKFANTCLNNFRSTMTHVAPRVALTCWHTILQMAHSLTFLAQTKTTAASWSAITRSMH